MSSSAIPFPTPRLAPVTSATRPLSFIFRLPPDRILEDGAEGRKTTGFGSGELRRDKEDRGDNLSPKRSAMRRNARRSEGLMQTSSAIAEYGISAAAISRKKAGSEPAGRLALRIRSDPTKGAWIRSGSSAERLRYSPRGILM